MRNIQGSSDCNIVQTDCMNEGAVLEPVDPCFGINSQFEQRTSIFSLDSFTPAFVDPNCTKEEINRRFLTFFIENKASYSSSMVLRKAFNTLNECFALKSPLFYEETVGAVEYKRASEEALQRYEEVQKLLTLEEYRNSLAVSHLKGFPRVLGLGNAKGKPIIVREYVKGITLAETIDLLPHVDLGARAGIEPITVAAIAKAVLRTLLNARSLEGAFVHRDLSPRNIIIRPEKASLQQQVDSCSFDICLVDLGSASYVEADSPFTTSQCGIWRFGTIEYAPPEMLTRDVEGVEDLRHSETIDTYALCSIMHLLLTLETPFKLASRINESAYLVKTNEQPQISSSVPTCKLLKLAEQGIKADQADRFTVKSLYDELSKLV